MIHTLLPRRQRWHFSPLDLLVLALVLLALVQLVYWDQLDDAPLFVDHGARLVEATPKRPGETFWIERDWEQYATPIYCNRSLVDHGVIPLPNHGASSERGRNVARFPVTLPDWMPPGRWIYHVECVTYRNPLHGSETTLFTDVPFDVAAP